MINSADIHGADHDRYRRFANYRKTQPVFNCSYWKSRNLCRTAVRSATNSLWLWRSDKLSFQLKPTDHQTGDVSVEIAKKIEEKANGWLKANQHYRAIESVRTYNVQKSAMVLAYCYRLALKTIVTFAQVNTTSRWITLLVNNPSCGA